MLDVIRGATESPVSTELLIQSLTQANFDLAIFYSGYPILSSPDKSSIDGLLISKDHGIIIFDIVEGGEISDRQGIRDEIYNLLYSKLISNRSLSSKRGELIVKISVLTFAPTFSKLFESNNPEIVRDNKELQNNLSEKNDQIEETDYRKVLEVIQAITKLKQKGNRVISKQNSKGDKLNKLEKSISNLDRQQSKAVIETTTGIQRIRGLAGSGKTIVLALKVAYLHSKNPDWKIGVTFYTRSLKDQFRDLITKFTIEHKGEEPDWNKINILQAWGSPKESGLYYQFCLNNNVEYFDFDSARNLFGRSRADLLGLLCEKALKEVTEPKAVYDTILIDETQDFSEKFLRLAYSLIKSHDIHNNKNKRLIYAYDELQNLSNTFLRNPKEIFGEDIDFKNEENAPKQDIILEKCYRNSGPVLITAHALGFGIYKEGSHPVTMFKQKEIWEDVGYFVEDGELDFGKFVSLFRSINTSPEYYKGIDPVDELIKFWSFNKVSDQYKHIADEIEKNIKEDELSPKDIIVIHPEAITAKDSLAPLRELLFERDIKSHLAGVTTSKDNFFVEDSVACTSIFRAKGNEGAMVYILNSDYCFGGYSLITKRNILFTAITRSKCWVRVCGTGKGMVGLIEEFKKIHKNNFRLRFTYPTIEEMEHLNVIHRELTSEEERKIVEANKEMQNLVKKLSEGEIKKTDLTKDQLENLRSLLNDN